MAAQFTHKANRVTEVTEEFCALTGHNRDEVLDPAFLYHLMSTTDLPILSSTGDHQLTLHRRDGRLITTTAHVIRIDGAHEVVFEPVDG